MPEAGRQPGLGLKTINGDVFMVRHFSEERKRQLRSEQIRQSVLEAIALMDRRFGEDVSFIRSPEAIEPGEAVVILSRVTTWGQEENGSLDRQVAFACETVREAGGKVAYVVRVAGVQAYSEEWFGILAQTFAKVAREDHRTVVLSELSRLVRHPCYRNSNVELRPTREQLQHIQYLAAVHDITVVLLCPANAPFTEERGHQTRRNGRSGRPRGRKTKKPGWCKAQRERFRMIALEAVDAGCSYRAAAERVNQAMRAEGENDH
jgi:hypothetical protein